MAIVLSSPPARHILSVIPLAIPPAGATSASARAPGSGRPPGASSASAGSGAPGGGGKGPQNRKVIYVLKGETLTPVRVKVGLTDGTTTEIVEGDLAEGDLVVTDTLHRQR